MNAPVVTLRPREERRLVEGHPWVFSNEIQGDAAALPPGGIVEVRDARGRFIGRGVAHPHSLIAVRLWSTREDEHDLGTAAWFERRLRAAWALRERVCPGRLACRWVAGEADLLPGLILDRYDETVVAQVLSLGMDLRIDALSQAVRAVLPQAHGVLRNDSALRKLEGLPAESRVWFGAPPAMVDFVENGARLLASPLEGHKTGHFFDQAANRAFALPLVRGASVLDVYAHTGAWAVQALVAGARSASCIDASEPALSLAREMAAHNGVALDTHVGDALARMGALADRGERFDVVFLDPPAFAKNRKSAGAALHAYRRNNEAAARLVAPGGLLFTSSCSHHVLEERFESAVVKGISDAGRRARIIRRGEQAPDHPVLPAMPETRYLKHRVLVIDDI